MNDPNQRATSPTGRGSRNRQQPAERHGQDTQPDLFNTVIDNGQTRTEAGQQQALHAADIRWKSAAQNVIVDLAATGRQFDAEDVRARVGVLASSPNTIGALFSSAARTGIIRPVGYRTATRAEAGGHLLRVWVGTGRGGAT